MNMITQTEIRSLADEEKTTVEAPVEKDVTSDHWSKWAPTADVLEVKTTRRTPAVVAAARRFAAPAALTAKSR